MFTVSEDPFVQEPVDENSSTKQLVFFGEMGAALKELSRPKWILLLITCLNWIAWFPFLLFDTNWIGKEVCRGKVGEGQAGETLQPRPRCGVKRLWGGVNFLLAVCLAMTVLVTKMAKSSREFTTLADGTTIIQPPSSGVKSGALAIFVVLGAPFALSNFTLCLSLGVLNLAIVIPQVKILVPTSNSLHNNDNNILCGVCP
ncbi:hypothetical protein Tco_1149312 [Tanacetum coccineum]